MAKLDLGKVKITFDGDWDSSKNYEELTIVNSAYNIKYISKKPTDSTINLTDTDYWEPICGQFVEKYQGASDSDPDTRLDGSDIQVGDLYLNTSDNDMKVYAGSDDGWIDVGTGGNAGFSTKIVDSDSNVIVNVITVVNKGDTTMTLPDADNGAKLIIIDGTGDAHDHNITVKAQADDVDINGSSDDLTCDVDNFNILFVYDKDNKNWLIGE